MDQYENRCWHKVLNSDRETGFEKNSPLVCSPCRSVISVWCHMESEPYTAQETATVEAHYPEMQQLPTDLATPN
jgi:hypothetical protein